MPVPVDGRFTYSIPPGMEGSVVVGSRVVVEFGPKKMYSGIVARLHDDAPAPGVKVKPLIEAVDGAPLVSSEQIQFWRWIASYYMCSEGDVMNAALPAGLRLASESVVEPDDDGPADGAELTPSERAAMMVLTSEGRLSISQLARKMGRSDVIGLVRSLCDKGAARVSEVMRGRFRPRRETRIELGKGYFSESRLREVEATLNHAPAQRRMLACYLEMSAATAAMRLRNERLLRPVAKAALLKEAGVSVAALEALRDKGVLATVSVDVSRLRREGVATMPPQPLSPAQQTAYDGIARAFADKRVCLLHGVTSSGKTEIYVHLIEKALRAGRSVLYLLPEIALTTQITQRLRMHFGDAMGVYHSKFPDTERVEIWKKQASAEPYRLIVGVRSALFLPLRDLGLIIVDEEHESSYKQEDPAPRYNARDAAIVMAARSGASVLLGTATPSLESYANARAGKYALVQLKERYGHVQLPEIRVENVRLLRHRKVMTDSLSPALCQEIGRALEAGQQAILFQNRRGYASYLVCHDCGWIPRCERCDVSLTLHRSTGRLMCHYCGATYAVPERCPECGGVRLDCHGVGTEQVERDVREAFPNARTARLDLDTTRGRTAYDDILTAFRNGETDILIGTQMVSKGLDFDRVRVVGILDADMALGVPDFRAYERAFQMMSQVAGRAGRRSARGIVILQTSQPESPLIGQVVRGDYSAMYEAQMAERREYAFPPYCRLIYAFVRSRYASRADDAARALAGDLVSAFGAQAVLGPAAPVVARVKLEHFRQIMIKVPHDASPSRVRQRLREASSRVGGEYRVTVYFDVDPL